MDDTIWFMILIVVIAGAVVGGYFTAKQTQNLTCPAQSCAECPPKQDCPTCPDLNCQRCKTKADCASCPVKTDCPTCPTQCAACTVHPPCPDLRTSTWPPAITARAPKNDSDADFQVCAVRDGTCTVPVGTPIFYGVGGAYAKKEATQTATVCSPVFFGGDPWPGRDKACWIPRTYPSASQSLETDPEFIKCASADGTCASPKGSSIFYGKQGKYAKIIATQSATPCSGELFGEPGIDLTKACYIRK